MRTYVIALAAMVLALPAVAQAGGFATVGLRPLPGETAPGEPWHVDLTILQHGRTPLEGLEPAVIVRRDGSRASRAFRAQPTARPGVYRATVTFPSAGVWRYVVDDGFTAKHTFAPVRIGGRQADAVAAPAVVPASSGGPDIGLVVGLAVVVGLAAAVMAGGHASTRSERKRTIRAADVRFGSRSGL
jgi:hypothetical protein